METRFLSKYHAQQKTDISECVELFIHFIQTL